MSEMPHRQVNDLPASFAQEQLWFIHEYNNGHPVLNTAGLVWVRGPLDVAALNRAVDAVVARHEVLRTRLVAGGDGRPVLIVDPPRPAELGLTDWAGLAREAAA